MISNSRWLYDLGWALTKSWLSKSILMSPMKLQSLFSFEILSIVENQLSMNFSVLLLECLYVTPQMMFSEDLHLISIEKDSYSSTTEDNSSLIRHCKPWFTYKPTPPALLRLVEIESHIARQIHIGNLVCVELNFGFGKASDSKRIR